MFTETDTDSLTSFLQGVKEGDIRGDVVQVTVSDHLAVELSVSTFEYGKIHLRVMVSDDRLDSADQYNHFQQLFRIDSQYEQFYEELVSIIEAENETGVQNAHSWGATSPNANHPEIPDSFSEDSMVWFTEYVDLREDLSIEEALRTNRE